MHMRFFMPMLLSLPICAAVPAKPVAPMALPAELPPHPRLLCNSNTLVEVQKKIATQPWAKQALDRLTSQADGWLKREVKLPDRGSQWYHYYSCPKHGARLRTESPTRHVCPVDKEVFTGYPYDDVVLAAEHSRLADGIRTCGLMYQLTKKPAYAAKGREILLAYAAKYESYPLHDIKGAAKVGGGKVGPQTLDESVWLITVAEGADCLWETMSKAERQVAAEKLFYPAAEVIRQHKMRVHNIQCWKNSAVGMTGLLLGDMKLVDEAVNGPFGYARQMAEGVSADGPWYENAWGYHFYTVSAVSHLTEGAWHCGINLYGKEYQRMFAGPLQLCMPDWDLPAFNDSHEVSLESEVSLYEIALARYGDTRFRPLVARGKRDSLNALLHGVPDAGKPGEALAVSGNYLATGNAVLAAGTGKEALWLCLDYGPHGGGHGHPDKLGFVAYSGQGGVFAPDPGTANYGVPIQAGWFRTSIAHNTLTVDEVSQTPAEGKCEAFIATNGFSAVTATAGKICGDVVFRRTIALVGNRLLLFLDQAASATNHTYDFAYHNLGRSQSPPGGQAFTPPQRPGYLYLRDTRLYESAAGFSQDFAMKGGQQMRWLSAGGSPTAYITGTGVGANTEDRVPLVIARCQGREAVQRWALLPNAQGVATLTAEPVTMASGESVKPIESAAVRVRTDAGLGILVVNAGGQPVRVAGQEIVGRLAWLEGSKDGAFRVVQQVR